MKFKKILSLILVVVMIFSVTSICASAETSLVYNGSANFKIGKATFDPDSFEVTLEINPRLIGSFDGQNADFNYEITSITTSDGNFTYDYLVEPEEFIANFTKEDFSGAPLTVNFVVEFTSTGIFGELEYTVNVDGFSAPLDLGGELGGLLGGSSDDSLEAYLPTTFSTTGTIDGFPSIIPSSVSVLSVPEKTDYVDSEKYDATGLSLSFSTSAGETGIFTYSNETAYAFSCVPSASQNLSCGDSEVAVMVIGTPVYYSPITVSHDWSDGPVNITTYKYTDDNPGFHAIVCEGCGETHTAEPHIPANAEWTSNNDQTFVANGTESNECAACGTVLTRDTFGTADYNTAFGDLHFLLVIFDYINVLLRFIGAAIG